MTVKEKMHMGLRAHLPIIDELHPLIYEVESLKSKRKDLVHASRLNRYADKDLKLTEALAQSESFNDGPQYNTIPKDYYAPFQSYRTFLSFSKNCADSSM